MSTNKSNKPELRFKGFSDDWEQRKFSEIAQRESSVRRSSSDFPSVEYEDVVSESGILNKDIRLKETQKTGIVFDGSQVLYGKLRPYLHNWLSPDFSGVAVGDWWVLKPANVDKNFLFRLIQTEKFDDIANQSAGSKMPRADWNLVSNTEFMVPKEIEEGRKIGQYFSNLDRLITLHQRKCDNLKIIKKSMLNNLFPKIGEKVPKWRFKGFNNDWEQRKLDSISEIKTGPFGSTLHADDYVTDGIPIITTEHFKNGDLPTSKNGLPQVSDEDYKRLSPYVLNEGDIVFSRVGSVDINALVIPSQRHWLFSGRVLRVRPDMTNDSQFLHTVLETETIKADIRSRAVGQTMPSINTEILNETLVMMPQLRAEQEQIGQFFYSLNKTITLHQSEVERLKKVKQFFLKKMFV